MRQPHDNWAAMFRELAAFKKRHGHCNAPADWPQNPALGRWIPAQRYKKSVNALPADRVRQLDDLGFVWSTTACAWEEMFQTLVQFRKKHKHCNVPTGWPEDTQLARWVQRQRRLKKLGKLPSERAVRLEKIGFAWAIYETQDQVDAAPQPKTRKRRPAPEQRLYRYGHDRYVQHDGAGQMPVELQHYMARHGGEMPPYFSLPMGTTVFRLPDVPREPKIRWNGKGSLPAAVLQYVIRNEVLPPQE